jgi:hypothetical protein
MESRYDTLLQLFVGPKPDSVFETDDPVMESIWWMGFRVDCQLLEELECGRIRGVASHHIRKPSRSWGGDCLNVDWRRGMPGKSIGRLVGGSWLVNDLVLQASQLSV